MSLGDLLSPRDNSAEPTFTAYADEWLLTELGRIRLLCSVETDERVRVFLGMRLESLILEMDRRSTLRIERKFSEGLS